MAPVVKFVVAALLVLAAIPGLGGLGVASAATDAAGPAAAPSPAPLVARLHLALSGMAAELEQQQGDGWMMECWGAVTELRSCTNEIVLFFLNGESYLGRDCCIAIRTVTLHCWPSMLASIGFTAKEADVLRGFCDAEIARAPPPPALAAPAAPAAVPAPAAQP